MVVRRFKTSISESSPFLLSGIGYGPKGKEALRRDAEVVRGKGYYVRIVQMGKDSALNGVPRWGAFVLPKRPKSGFRGLGMMNPFSWINASQANVVMPQRKIRNPEALETMFYYGKNQDKDAIVIDKSWFDFDGRIVEITAEELEEDRKENPAEIWGDFILGENDAQYHMTEPALEEADATIPPIRIYSKNMNVDCTGMNCPYPVLMAKNALKEMQPGETLTLTATDWEAEYDVPLLAERYGHELESVEKNRATGEIIFTIKKGGSRSYNQEKGDVPFRKSLEKSGNYIQCAGCGSKTKSRCRCEGGKTMSPMVDYSEEERLKGKRKFNKRRFNKKQHRRRSSNGSRGRKNQTRTGTATTNYVCAM